MVAITLGSIVTAGWTAYKYWRVPYRFYQWRGAPEVEPQSGQIWTEAGLSASDKKWKVEDHDGQGIQLKQDVEKDPETVELSWEDWCLWVKKSRLYCSDRNDGLHDRYWGSASEE